MKRKIFLQVFISLSVFTLSGYVNSQPSAVQNAQAVYDDATSSFVVTWDAPPEGVTEYYLTSSLERMNLNSVNGDNQELYGYEVEKDYELEYDIQDPFPPSVTQIVMSVGSDGYGYDGRAFIRPINNQGSGPTTSFDLGRTVDAPSPSSNLTYEIREDDLVAYFSWDAPSISYAPTSAELYYKVNYITDAGVSRTKYYSSDFAALDLTDNQYWDYSVSACIYETCSVPTSIRATPAIRELTKVENDFESDLTGINGGWIANGWTRKSGSTPTSLTGPQSADSGSFYAYLESSSAQTGDAAILESTSNGVFDRLYFSYHMYGSSMGSLYVDLFDDGSWFTVWQKTGQQHTSSTRAWSDVEIDLSPYDFGTRVRFRGVDGNGYRGDMAIDNVRITKFEEVETKQAFEYHFLNAKNQTPGVFAIGDNTQIQLNSSIPVTVNAGSSVDLGQIKQGDVIHSNRPIAIGSNTNGADMPVPNDFAGSEFVIPLQRQTHYIYVKNINSFSVDVDFYDGNSSTTQVIAAGAVVRLDTGLNGVSAIIKVADEHKILVSHRTSANGDAYPVPPSSLEVFGIKGGSFFGVQEDGTTIKSYASNGSSVELIQNKGDRSSSIAGTSGGDGNGNFVRILADKPIAAVQYADSDGSEQTGFWPLSMFATDYVLPVDVQYVAIGCISDTDISVYSSSGSYLQDVSCNGSRVHPGKAFLGSSTIEDAVQFSAGTQIVSDEPIYLIYETFATDDEHNLMGAADTDGDGIYNSQDEDSDNDGEPDLTDAFPFDDSEQADFDGDGIGNNVDTDEDIDGIDTGFNLKAEYSNSPHGLKISWSELDGASYYELVRSTNNGNSWVNRYSGSEVEYIDTEIGGFNGALYYRIRACRNGCSVWTSTPASAQ